MTEKTGKVVNGGSSNQKQPLTRNSHLSGELKSLVGSLLGTSAGAGISLQNLLSANTSQRRQPVKSSTVSPGPPHMGSSGNNPPTPGGSGWAAGGRKRPAKPPPSCEAEADGSNPKRRRTSASYSTRQSGEKQHNKGLRHFSQRVCEKVREKGTTTYNEVADELVKELTESEKKTPGLSDIPIDHKNIRRRVYDALNVLMAMNIISKEKKEIKWIGLPTNSVQECQHIQEELVEVERRIHTKKRELEELLVQILSFKNLMRRNRARLAESGAPMQNSAISLPFIIVNTSKKTTIDCSISSDKSEYVFNFDSAFELYNDVDILKKMGLDCRLHSGVPSSEDVKQAKAMLPKAFESTLNDIAVSKNSAAAVNAHVTPPRKHLASHTSTPIPASSLTPLQPGTSSVPTSPFAPPIDSSSPLVAAVLSSLVKHSPDAAAPLQVSPQKTSIQSGLPSPSAVTALMNTALRGGKQPPVMTRPLGFLTSPATSSAKTQMHSHCSPKPCVSPLVKSIAPSGPTAQSAPSKSPGPKLVTVSKLPASSSNDIDLTAAIIQVLQNGIKQAASAGSAQASSSNQEASNFTE